MNSLSVFDCFYLYLSKKLRMNFISVIELNQIINQPDCLVIDIRELYEREICAIPSIHIPMNEIGTSDVHNLDSKKIVLLCKSGRRAEVVANYLEREKGHTDLYVVEGGILAWIENIDNTLETY
jgi:rhodanese-related sulfurtransferase